MLRVSPIILGVVVIGFPLHGTAQSISTTDGRLSLESRYQLPRQSQRQSYSGPSRSLQSALPVATARNAVSDVVGHWLVRAEAERLLATAIADASAAKATQLDKLHESGYAGWTEWASARSDSVRDAARRTAAERFANWLRSELEANPGGSTKGTQSLAESVTLLELSLPGSRAVLGWVQPNRLGGDARHPILELLLHRSALLVESDDEISAARRKMNLLEQRARTLSRMAEVGSAERKAAAGQLRIAAARLAVAEATYQQLHFDHAALELAVHSLKTCERNEGVSGREKAPSIAGIHEAPRAAAVALRQRALEVLAFESQTGGKIEMARAARQWARLHAAGCEALQDRQQISIREWQRAQRDLCGSLIGWEQLTALRDWHGRWEHQLRRDGAVDGVRFAAGISSDAAISTNDVIKVAGGESGDALTMAQRRNVARTRKSIVLMRQWCDASADFEAEKAERDWRSAVISHLQAQQTPNEREIAVASSAVTLCDGRVWIAGEHVQLIRLLWLQEATNDADDIDVPYELSLIGDVEAGVILDAAASRVENENSSVWTERVVAAERRVEGLKQLRAMGHASAEELARVELSLTTAREERAASSRRRQLAKLERALTERLLGLGRSSIVEAETLHEPMVQDSAAPSRP
jgi:hypothetical protein